MTVLKLLADAFHEGGWGMWPILTLLMLTISIITERAVVLRKAVIDKEKLLALLRSQISQGNIQGAIKEVGKYRFKEELKSPEILYYTASLYYIIEDSRPDD